MNPFGLGPRGNLCLESLTPASESCRGDQQSGHYTGRVRGDIEPFGSAITDQSLAQLDQDSEQVTVVCSPEVAAASLLKAIKAAGN